MKTEFKTVVKGKSGDYTVYREDSHGKTTWSCTCPAGNHGRSCRHIAVGRVQLVDEMRAAYDEGTVEIEREKEVLDKIKAEYEELFIMYRNTESWTPEWQEIVKKKEAVAQEIAWRERKCIKLTGKHARLERSIRKAKEGAISNPAPKKKCVKKASALPIDAENADLMEAIEYY